MNQEPAEAGKAEQPDAAELAAALDRGLADVAAGRVQPIENVKSMIPQWILKSRTDNRA